jgi:hypothetical protein
MHVLPPVHEFSIVGVYDPGAANRERIILRPTQRLNLAEFAICISHVHADGSVTPIPDLFLWLGDFWIAPPCWVVIFTGPGAFRQTTDTPSGELVFELHWGRANTIFNGGNLAVSLVRLGAINSVLAPKPVRFSFADLGTQSDEG